MVTAEAIAPHSLHGTGEVKISLREIVSYKPSIAYKLQTRWLRDSESGRTRVNWTSSKPSTRSRPAFEAGSFVEVRVSAILSVPLKRRRPLERGGTGLLGKK